jgi:hypothetical protein
MWRDLPEFVQYNLLFLLQKVFFSVSKLLATVWTNEYTPAVSHISLLLFEWWNMIGCIYITISLLRSRELTHHVNNVGDGVLVF